MIAKNARFKNPNVVNMEYAQQAIKKGEQVWVAPLIMKPGKHSVFFSQVDKNGQQNVALQTCMVNVRHEKVAYRLKPSKASNEAKAVFDKDASVFALWKDNNRLFEQHDFTKWKLDRFVKQHEDQVAVKEFFKDKMHNVKEIYANL